jgi:thiol:disulfide interchange protein DsbA
MRGHTAALLGAALLGLALQAHGAGEWQEGKHYFAIKPALRTSVPKGKVEVAEVFSYGCPACSQFDPIADRIEAGLPSNAVFVYVPASFIASEQWPMFQRAYLAAKALGIDERTHKAMFHAIWASDELAVIDVRTHRLKNPPPTLEDAAKFYARSAGVKPKDFLAAAKSFSVEMNMKRADEWIKSGAVHETPTLVVNGKYRLTVSSAGGVAEMLELINWLVAKETGPGVMR